MNLRILIRRLWVLLVLVGLYLLLGLGFHIGWEQAQEVCRAERAAQGEFVEPPVFWWPIRLAFTVINWPIYAWWNYYHDGTIFATPCTH
ncbi:MAG: hypothetical protein ACPLTQ_02480 [Anaerolineae bacterium]